MTTIDTFELKRKMLNASIEKQQALIDDFKTRIQNILDTSGLGNEEEYDNNELSQKAQASQEIDSLNQGLKMALDEMEILKTLTTSLSSDQQFVALGAVVVTNRDTFFVSVSTEQFEADGKTFTGVSLESPLYSAMKGKKTGEKFSCKGLTYKIHEIF
jgi:hypothetical protein